MWKSQFVPMESRADKYRPIMALVGGLHAPPGRIMGHAGAWTAIGEPGAKAKYEALERAGVMMVNHPEKFGEGMKSLLKTRGRAGTPVGLFHAKHDSLLTWSSLSMAGISGEAYIQ